MYARQDGFSKKIKSFWLLQRSQVGGLTLFLVTLVFVKGWVAKVSARTHTCNVQAFVWVQNPLWKVCAMCVRAACFQACHCHNSYIRRGICDCTFAHFLEQNSKKMPFFVLKTILECPYPVLEHLFLLWYVLSCFRTSYSVSEQQKNVEGN